MMTLNSMTGFASATSHLETGSINLELRAVNSRYLDLSFRMADDFRNLEPLFRERIGDKVKRGKIECRLGYTAKESGLLPSQPNIEVLEQLASLADQIRHSIPDARPMSIAEILRWPGMLGETTCDPDQLQTVCLALLDDVIRHFNLSRAQEGAKLAAFIQQRIETMRDLVGKLRPHCAEIVTAFRDKISRRMEEILQGTDPVRIHQEVALFAQKIDVDEELDRLSTHLDEVERVLKQGGAAGKRLDFLMQELNREANTLGSKAAATLLSQTSVEMKVLIEQMREQVQNLE